MYVVEIMWKYKWLANNLSRKIKTDYIAVKYTLNNIFLPF